MAKKQTAVEWLEQRMPSDTLFSWKVVFEKAKQMEKEQEYETKAFWFGRGILAGKENKIEELSPIRDIEI